jgi:hypothetical protein
VKDGDSIEVLGNETELDGLPEGDDTDVPM